MQRNVMPTRGEYPGQSGAQAASSIEDHGRRIANLPWLYLDNNNNEFGPVPGRLMSEWLAAGRFPVGAELRVRLPEWERHLPLIQLFPDMNQAFQVPPSWPDVPIVLGLTHPEPAR
mmetsp:Transcript_506/g.703  ORF Transcript_506/g.703 Transcript_506/m.703 type:complete len:116 (-) Transcript_506:250-597(-)